VVDSGIDGAEDAQEEDGEDNDFEEEEEEAVQPVASLEPVDDDDEEEEPEPEPEDPQQNFQPVGEPRDPKGCMIMPRQGRNPRKVYNEMQENMDNDPLHLSPISCHSPIYGKDPHEYPNNQSPDRCGEQKCSYDIRGCHTTLNLIYQVVICEEELLLQGFMRCTLLYTTVAGTTVPKSGIWILKYFL